MCLISCLIINMTYKMKLNIYIARAILGIFYKPVHNLMLNTSSYLVRSFNSLSKDLLKGSHIYIKDLSAC